MNDTICVACGGPCEVVECQITVTSRDGGTVTAPDRYLRCPTCGEEFYTSEMSMALSNAVTAARAAAGHPVQRRKPVRRSATSTPNGAA